MRNDVSCKFFSDCLHRIMTSYKLETFHGTTWTVVIDKSPAKGTRKIRSSKGSQGSKGTRKSSSTKDSQGAL